MNGLRPLVTAIASAAVLCTAPAFAQGSSADFDAANALAYKGNYASAVASYEAIVASGVDDPALYHNLGNAHFRAGALGQAIWAFRRGLRCDPEPALEDGLSHNVQITRQALQARYRASNDGSQFIYSEPGDWLYQLSHMVSLPALLWSFLALWWLLGLCLVLRRFSANRGWGSLAVPLVVLVLLVGGLLAGRISTDDRLTLGVVVADGVIMREGPDAHARGVDVPEGMEVRVLDATEGWHKVEIPSGRSGWVSSTALRVL